MMEEGNCQGCIDLCFNIIEERIVFLNWFSFFSNVRKWYFCMIFFLFECFFSYTSYFFISLSYKVIKFRVSNASCVDWKDNKCRLKRQQILSKFKMAGGRVHILVYIVICSNRNEKDFFLPICLMFKCVCSINFCFF